MKQFFLPLCAASFICLQLSSWNSYAAQESIKALVGEGKADVDDRKIAPSDIIIIEVFGEKDLSGEHRVQQSGTIKYPLLGSVDVAGKTPSEVGKLLQDKLEADFLVDPQVN